jgi:hypothetical protein
MQHAVPCFQEVKRLRPSAGANAMESVLAQQKPHEQVSTETYSHR